VCGSVHLVDVQVTSETKAIKTRFSISKAESR
jgi:hypothetical protein